MNAKTSKPKKASKASGVEHEKTLLVLKSAYVARAIVLFTLHKKKIILPLHHSLDIKTPDSKTELATSKAIEELIQKRIEMEKQITLQIGQATT